MSDSAENPKDPDWLNEFEELANRELKAGSSCEQVHPVVERWYHQILEVEPPASRDSVLQAMACLSTEIMHDAPDEISSALLEVLDEDALAGFIEYVLMVGRAFEISLQKGELDDL
jgi:hypothetical protein